MRPAIVGRQESWLLLNMPVILLHEQVKAYCVIWGATSTIFRAQRHFDFLVKSHTEFQSQLILPHPTPSYPILSHPKDIVF